jgi:glycosyltransferase involved in cell wall biosynthesis
MTPKASAPAARAAPPDLRGQRILLATMHFRGFTGSELNLLELAEVLAGWGADVTLGAIQCKPPALDEARARGLRALAVQELAAERGPAFDLAWIQQAQTYGALLDQGIVARQTVLSVLSPYEPREVPPLTCGGIHLVLANSAETRDRLIDGFGLPADRIHLLLNSAPEGFFALAWPGAATDPPRLRRVAVVSNHMPAEIAELAELLPASQVALDRIGQAGSVRRVTPGLLAPYDAVISIGKTVPYCLALGIPVFVYDHYGGPGWLNEDNWQRAEQFNYSGRCTPIRQSAAALRDALLGGYAAAHGRAAGLRTVAGSRYRLAHNVAEVLNRLRDIGDQGFDILPTPAMLRATRSVVGALQSEINALHDAALERERDRQMAWSIVERLQRASAGAPARPAASSGPGPRSRGVPVSKRDAGADGLDRPRRRAVGARRALVAAARATWQRMPLSTSARDRIKGVAFRLLKPWLRQSDAYRRWQVYTAEHVHLRRVANLEAKLQQGGGPVAESAAGIVPVPLATAPAVKQPAAVLVAFYLPQFHPIPENDAWWGRGFTEWSNVTRATPRFPGHYQPRLPGELGFYDLRLPGVQQRQVELARLYGLGAFCFYFYWFGGKRLLELPLLRYLEDRALDLPFCLCWANENWSRRWDGREQDLLMVQEHSPQDDLAFIEYVSRYLRDPRYLRVDGCPVLLVYRPNLLPCMRATAQRWRDWCQAHGIGRIRLLYTQSFEAVDPAVYGLDGAVEFPPNLTATPLASERIDAYDADFASLVYEYGALVESSRHYRDPGYPIYRGVAPSWDNEARKPGRGALLLGSSPEAYRTWLTRAVEDTVDRYARPDERLVFINAWNEWAEGAYLEPDRRYGYAYLQATADALREVDRKRARRRVVLVSHDAHPNGAQFLALHLARGFSAVLGYAVDLVVLGAGPLKESFAQVATVHDLAGVDPGGPEAHDLAARLRAAGASAALCNTTAAGRFGSTLKHAGLRCVSLIHEMPSVIEQHGLEAAARAIARDADLVVFPAAIVAERFARFATVAAERTAIRPQGLYKRNRYRDAAARQRARLGLRTRLGLPEAARVVLGVGYADQRKGIDLFVAAGLRLMGAEPNLAFVWLGHREGQMRRRLEDLVDDAGMSGRFLYPGMDPDTDEYYAGADVLALTSREDPFPSVVLEAMDAGIPTVLFEGTGGCGDLVADGYGIAVTAFDVAAYASALAGLLDRSDEAARMGARGAQIVQSRFGFHRYLFDLASWLGLALARVSVIVPNYNYERYLEERLGSIARQTHPAMELIVLDDASTDGSVALLQRVLPTLDLDASLHVNERNSGSVFRQWRKGAELARGDLVWIAEADDSCAPGLLAELVRAFDDPQVVLAYCQSRQVAGDGAILSDDYLDYVADISTTKWRAPYVEDGQTEIRTALAVKNTLPNASAVLFRRTALLRALQEEEHALDGLRVAGDWVVYLAVLRQGKIAFSPEALNSHRRHEDSVTIASFNQAQLQEIVAVQRRIAAEFAPPAQTVRQAQAYAQKLFEQFGLQTPHGPRLQDHPAFAPPQ